MDKMYGFTKEDIKEICKNIVILVDTREQNNKHIIYQFDKNKINYKSKALDYGDYSFFIRKNDIIGNTRDIYFNNKIVIERKNSLEELSNNFTKDRQRFENELIRKRDTKFILMIEEGSYKDIFEARYNTQFKSNSYIATLLSFQLRYNIDIAFVDKKYVYKYIYSAFYYFIHEIFKD